MQNFFVTDPAGATLLIFISMLMGVSLERARFWFGRKEWQKMRHKRRRSGTPPRLTPKLKLVDDAAENAKPGVDPAEQLRLVMAANFRKRSILNRSELRVFSALERELANSNCGWRLMAQVSVGEIVGSDDKAAYWAINAKRVDFLIVDSNGSPQHAIEYQGAGHYQDAAVARDATKKEALRKAGIGYHEVINGDRIDDVRQLVAKLVRKTTGATQSAFGKK